MSKFTVAYTIYGDANLDGKVDVNDLTIVLSHFGKTSMTWSQGDFNYDGKVDVNDITIMLTHFGQSLSAPPAELAPCRAVGPVIGRRGRRWHVGLDGPRPTPALNGFDPARLDPAPLAGGGEAD